MKKLIVVACLALGAGILFACELGANGEKGVVATAVAQEKGCSNIGTWVTAIPEVPFDENDLTQTPPWISTDTGMSASSGAIVTDVPHWPNITFVNPDTGQPTFPEAVRMTELKGVWERTSGNTLAFTQVGWAVDAKGDPQYIVRNSGTTTFTDDCNTEIIKSTMEWLLPNGTRIFGYQLPDMIGHRLLVTPPEPPLE